VCACTFVSMLGLMDFTILISRREDLIDFLIEHGVLASTITCSKCGNNINIDKETLFFRCQRRQMIKNKHKKRVSMKCNYKRSARTGTWFHKSNLDIAIICRLIACFLMLKHPRQDDTQDETGLTSATIVDWFNFCREVIIFYYILISSMYTAEKYIVMYKKMLILFLLTGLCVLG